MTELVHAPPREVAQAFKASGLFPDLKSEAQAYVKVVAGAEMGIGPMASMTGINVIQGKPTFSANLLAALLKRHPAYDYRVKDHTDESCRIVFYQHGEEVGTSEFSMDDAKRAGVAGGQNWRKFPKAMLFARALTQGVRWHAPDVTAGPAYVPEELEQEAEVVEVIEEPTPLIELGELVREQLTDEEAAALREWLREGDLDEKAAQALELLQEGNKAALLAGLEFDHA